MKKSSLSFSFFAVLLVILPLTFLPEGAQAGQPAHPQTPAPSASPTPARTPATSASPEETPAPEHKLTPEESRDLLGSVDEIMQFASQATLLPVKHRVKKAIVSREHVAKYLDDKMESDVDRIRFERSELVLKKFGLLPRTFDLHSFLIKLLTEQVAGYYDEKTKTMNLLDWNDADMQKPVMAHELTHALQDQSYNLDKMSKHEEAIEKRGLEDLDDLLRNDEASSARTAVLEGQAMIVMLDYVMAPSGLTVKERPEAVDMMQSMSAKSKDSPVFDSAPLLLQEELIFPYREGMVFIKELLVEGDKREAFMGALDRMPQTTREIMEPKEYLAGRRVPPLLLPDMGFLKKEYEGYDAGAIGELDVEILLKVYADDKTATRLCREWRGGAYYAAGRRGVAPSDKNSSGHVGLYYISKWSNEAAAQEFAKIYASALKQRYSAVQRVADQSNPGLQKYSTNDGLIFIQQTGNAVVVTESFDPASANLLIQSGLKQTQQEAQSATSTVH